MTIDDLLNETRAVTNASREVIAANKSAATAEVESSIARIRVIARRRTQCRRVAGALIATAACGAALLVLPRDAGSPPPKATAPPQAISSTPPASPPPVDVKFKNASQVLRVAADAPGPNEIAQDSDLFWRVDSVDRGPDGYDVARSLWFSRDAGTFLTDSRDPGGEATRMGGPTNFGTLGRILSWDDLFELPVDQRSMLQLLRGSSGRADADRIAFKTIFELLSSSPAPQKVRRALWRAAAALDGVTLVGEATDTEGRQGWAITDGTSTYVISPQTGRLLESRYTSPDGKTYTTTILREGSTPIAPKVADSAAPVRHR